MVQNICKKVEGFLSYRGFPKSGRTNPGLPLQPSLQENI